MSGNPFRISQHQKQSAINSSLPSFSPIDTTSSAADSSGQALDTVNASPLPTKTKKSVRIKSPTSSPPHPAFPEPEDALLQRISRTSYTGSETLTSPPLSGDSTRASFEDRLDQDTDSDDGSEGEGLMKNTRRSSGMAEEVHRQSSSGTFTKSVQNPFQKTLATIEPSAKSSAEHREALSDRPVPERTGSGNARASMDVESFKRLLMTGSANPSSSGTPSAQPVLQNPIHGAIIESSSSTDTSSISRQSIFEPMQEVHAESPRTSYELAASDDDERVGLVGDNKKTEKKKPPPPKHRHGKLVTSRQPQTVSFSDFSATVQAPPPPSPRTLNRIGTDLNKPLPPPPPITSPPPQIVTQDETPERPSIVEPLSSPSESPAIQKKAPPPPPIARRHSQLRSSNTKSRSRSNSALTTSSQISENSASSLYNEPIQSQSQKAPPPPPPSRRHGNSITSSANTSSTELPTMTSSRQSTVTSPPPPASRRSAVNSPPSSPSQPLARTASVGSNRAPRSTPSLETSTNMPPPPPPPRRRQSGRSSLDKERPKPRSSTSPSEDRRTSSELKRSSFDSSRRRASVTSESSLRHEYAPTQEYESALYSPQEEGLREEPLPMEPVNSNTSDILDDMERLQREVDALRDKYRKTS